MKTPIDATGHTGATVALLNGSADFQVVDLWKITLNGGAVLRWHGGPTTGSLTFTTSGPANGTYVAGPPIERGKLSTKLGLQVATLDMIISSSDAVDQINGISVLAFLTGRGFDGATVVLYRAYLTDWGQPIIGATIEFSGRVTQIKDITRTKATVSISSWLVLLNVNVPVDVFQTGCLNQLYDPTTCQAVKATFTTTGSVTALSGVNGMNTTLTAADGYYSLGIVTFTSGANNGLSRAVQAYLNASGHISVAFPWPTPPSVGDTFTISAGCDLTMATCTGRFNNLIHFRGQTFTPPAVTGVVG